MRLPWVNRAKATVVVLGMHRSGTSMVAGAIRALGVHMGEELLPAYASNPLGHFEAKDIVELNDQILTEAGGSWDHPPTPRAILVAGKKYRRSVEAMLRRRNRRHTIWGWKDPRTVLTFPIYAEYLRNARLVVCTRSCSAVASSLTHRDMSHYADNLKLCEEYGARIAELLRNSRLPRLHLEYDSLRLTPDEWVRRIDSFIGTGASDQGLSAAESMILDESSLHQAKLRFDESGAG